MLSCGAPSNLQTHKAFANKKVVIVSVPGAFTPTCTETHAPAYVAHSKELRAKGVDEILIIAANDFFVMSAWGKALGDKGEIVRIFCVLCSFFILSTSASRYYKMT